MPNRPTASTTCGGVRFWSRTTSTLRSTKARFIAARSWSETGRVRSIPSTSAPVCELKGLISTATLVASFVACGRAWHGWRQATTVRTGVVPTPDRSSPKRLRACSGPADIAAKAIADAVPGSQTARSGRLAVLASTESSLPHPKVAPSGLLGTRSGPALNRVPFSQRRNVMPTSPPDQSFYPSPRMAMKAAPETLAYVAAFDPDRKVPDEIAVVDVDPGSSSYSKIVGTTAMPHAGDELHHFGWKLCSSCLCPNAPHPHVERRYLVVPGLRSSRIHILDTKPDPRKPSIVKGIGPAEVAEGAGYTRRHTVHCGPEGIYVAALGNREGKGPGGIFLMDHETFDVRGQWEMDRGPQYLAYDAWWHLGHDTLVTSEWGTPDTFEDGLIPEVLLGAKYGRRLHFWDLHGRKHLQTID